MTVLSASHSGFVKRVLPFLAIAGACGWSYWFGTRDGQSEATWTYVAIAVVLAVVMVVVLRRGLWSMADSVEDSGDALHIRRWRTIQSIPIVDVKSIEREPSLVGSVVTLHLSRPSAFGSAIRFYAPDARKVPNIINDLESLAIRVRSKGGSHVA